MAPDRVNVVDESGRRQPVEALACEPGSGVAQRLGRLTPCRSRSHLASTGIAMINPAVRSSVLLRSGTWHFRHWLLSVIGPARR